MLTEDPLTPEEQAQVDRSLPVLGKNPPGIDLGAIFRRLRDAINVALAAVGVVAVDRDGPGSAAINSGTWTATDSPPPTGGVTVTEAGDYMVLFTAEASLAGTASDFQFGFSIDDADPVSGDSWNHDFLSASFFGPVVAHRSLTLTAGQTIQVKAQRLTGTGTMNIPRRQLTAIKIA